MTESDQVPGVQGDEAHPVRLGELQGPQGEEVQQGDQVIGGVDDGATIGVGDEDQGGGDVQEAPAAVRGQVYGVRAEGRHPARLGEPHGPKGPQGEELQQGDHAAGGVHDGVPGGWGNE